MALLAACWGAAMPVGWAEEEPAPPPPKVRRVYSGRTTLVDPKAQPAQPVSASSLRIPLAPAPGGSSMDALLKDSGPASLPVTLPAPNRPPTTREEDRKIKTWEPPDDTGESKPSGWGWLADDLMRTLQVTSSEDRVRGEESARPDPFSREEADERMPRPDESEDGQPAAEVRPVDGQSAAMTEEELVRAKLNEVSSSTAPEGWRPIGLALEDRGWNPAGGAAGDRDRYAEEAADRSRSAYEAPALEDPTRRWSAPGDNLSGLAAASEARSDNADRGVFKASGSSSLGAFEPSRGSSLFDPATPSLGGGSSGLGFSTPTPVFGSMSAVDIQPSLSVGSSLAPALSLPSSSTPSLGGMGTEMEARPKTLPW